MGYQIGCHIMPTAITYIQMEMQSAWLIHGHSLICKSVGPLEWLFNSLRPSDAYICVSKLTIIGSDNGLSPDRRQAIIWTNAGILLTGPLGTNFSEILIEILTFSFKKMRLKVLSAKRRPFCLSLNVLTYQQPRQRPQDVFPISIEAWCIIIISIAHQQLSNVVLYITLNVNSIFRSARVIFLCVWWVWLQ